MKPRILLAVDGSETSLKAVKHVGEILCGGVACEITLFHVLLAPPMFLEHVRAEDADTNTRLGESLEERRHEWVENSRARVDEEIFTPAKQILAENGVRGNGATIRTRLIADGRSDVALAICREVKEGDYDAVVLGRRGRSSLSEFLFGCVAHKVLHNIGGCRDRAIWVVE